MPERSYTGLPEFGLPLVTPADPRFAELVREIVSRPDPFPKPAVDDLDGAAVLLNESGKAIVALSLVWRFGMADGTSCPHRHNKLGSSTQMAILNGRVAVPQDIGTCILAGSKRLLTEEGIHGNNLDVLAWDPMRQGGFASVWGLHGREIDEQATSIELTLDAAIFDDGLCVGPDESGFFDDLIESLNLQRRTAECAVAAMRNGASDGEMFEMVKPLASRRMLDPATGGARRPAATFGRMAIEQLINVSREELLAWFEGHAQPAGLTLRRP